jgi:hypothetical protein
MASRVEGGNGAVEGFARWALALTTVIIGMGWAILAPLARAEGCPNEPLRGQEGAALRLPDCRAYEQVSPVDKNFTDALGEADVVQSSPSGEGVTFFSDAPFPEALSATGPSLYIGTRADGEWSTQGLVPPTAPRSQPEYGSASVLGLSEDLHTAIVNTEPGLEADMVPGRYSYIRDDATGALRLLAPGVVAFADAAADDSRIVFESSEQLMPEASPNAVNLYEWADGRLRVVGILPASEGGQAPSVGSAAGPGGPALGKGRGGATSGFYAQDTISEDGSRVFFSDRGTGRIYMREPEAGRTIPISGGTEPAYWRAATADGSEVFYTEGEALYRFSVDAYKESKKPEAEALVEAREQLTNSAAGVLGTLGIATETGSYAYFVATTVLAGNENANEEVAEEGEGNLYEWHDGKTRFIARLSTEDLYDEYNWRDFYKANPDFAPATGEKSSRVTPEGTTVLFTSRRPLTSYDNDEQGELYLYDATSGTLSCVSCSPSGTPATSEAYLADNLSIAPAPARNAFLTRNLSEDGNRVFFQTEEALLPQDKNEQTDVYEWEREGAGGSDSCSRSSASFDESSGGCLYLISTGESDDQSYFGDASANGDNVFFFTRQSLVGQDRDENNDLYDARVDGGIAAQNQPSATGCGGEGCLGSAAAAPIFAAPSSATFVGPVAPPLQPAAKSEPLTRAQKLDRALKACRSKSKKQRRRTCEARTRKRYGKHKAKKTARARGSVRGPRP